MNVWECDAKDCDSKCIGVGGAIGLRAIGWYFVPGWRDNCFCPRHRPDKIPCDDQYTPEDKRQAECALCCGEHEARRWQDQIMADLGLSSSL